MKKFIPILLLIFSCGANDLSLATKPDPPPNFANTTTEAPSETDWFKMIVMDVGQGAASLLVAPDGEAALIDTGPAEVGAKQLAQIAKDQGIIKLNWILISHPHADHNGSLQQIRATALGGKSQILDHKSVKVGETLSLDRIAMKILAADGKVGDRVIATDEEKNLDKNAMSVAMVIEYGAFRLLAAGDLPGGGGDPPYETIDLETPLAPLVGDIDILLVPHHGSHTSSNDFFLDTIKPEVGIISLGNGNDYFHPHPSLIQRLKDHRIEIWQTEQGWLKETTGIQITGSICILSNGKEYKVKSYSVDKCQAPD